MEEKSITVKELKEFIKDLPDKTKVVNNLSKGEEIALVYKKRTACSDVLFII